MKNEKENYLDVIFKMTFDLSLPVDLYPIFREENNNEIGDLLRSILDSEVNINKFIINERGMIDLYFNVLTDDPKRAEHGLLNYQHSDSSDYFTLGDGINFDELQIHSETLASFTFDEDFQEFDWDANNEL